MSDDVSRRRVIGAAALATSLAGCASVLDRSDSADTTGTASRTTESTVAEERTGEPTTEAADEASFDASSVEVDRPAVSFPADAPLPSDPEQYGYATAARGEPAETATVYGSWKCPYTRAFVLEQVDDIVADFVEPGALALQFRFVGYRTDEPFLGDDAPRASRAGLAVWDADPAGYWRYLAYVFENQPAEREEWAQPDLLVRFAAAAGVDGASELRQRFDDEAHARTVRATTDAAVDAGVHTVPRVVADGEVTAPTLNPDATRAQLERAADR